MPSELHEGQLLYFVDALVYNVLGVSIFSILLVVFCLQKLNPCITKAFIIQVIK